MIKKRVKIKELEVIVADTAILILFTGNDILA